MQFRLAKQRLQLIHQRTALVRLIKRAAETDDHLVAVVRQTRGRRDLLNMETPRADLIGCIRLGRSNPRKLSADHIDISAAGQ
jgi:hypothetical protein